MTQRVFIAGLFLFVQYFLIGQSTQNIKGIIYDKQSDMPLIGATIIVVDSDPLIGSTTDVNGHFILAGAQLGRHNLYVSYLGYEGMAIPNVEVTAGKEVFLDIGIEESVDQLDEIVVVAKTDKHHAQNEMATISARTFSVEEVNRYSGGRGDVARLATNFAGVSTSDDARNDIVIRGNSPSGVLWRMEGIPIPNPNHFSSLGSTGGPVSALNTNLLKNSDFITSAFPAEYGNALSGVFDLGLRSGNKDKTEFTGQVGAFTGFELMAEGPINKEKQSSYIVAGRYSFAGLASQSGLDIGTNATPDYQDIGFNIDLGYSSIGNISIFGIGGRSKIDFFHNEVDSTDIFAAKDEDLFPESYFGVLGVKHNLILDEKTYLRNIIAFSTTSNSFSVDRYYDLDTENESSQRIREADNTEVRTSLSSFVNRKFNAKLTARAGVLVENYAYDIKSRDREFTPDWVDNYTFDDQTWLLQSYIQGKYKFNSRLSLNMGLHAQVLTLNNTWSTEPRLSLNYNLSKKSTLSLGYGLHSQVVPLPILLAREEVSAGVFEETNRQLDPTRSQHMVVGYDMRIRSDWRVKAEVYYQYIDRVAVESTPTSFSILNLGDDFGFPDDKFSLVNNGTGSNYGLELTLEKFFSKGYYGLMTASFYDSKYVGSDEIERNTAFNNRYIFNILGGKEFKIGKGGRNAFTIDSKFTLAGGRYYTPVDLEASRLAGKEIDDEQNAYSQKYSSYVRWDLKFGFKLNSRRRKLSHFFFIDIANVTNRTNIFAKRYNRLTNEVNDVDQLGFFPDFVYRIQF